MARAAQATIQAHGGASGRGGGGASSAGGGGSASSSSARTSAVMRSVCVSTPATSARRSSAKCSRSARVGERLGVGRGEARPALCRPRPRTLTGVKVDCSVLRRSGTRCSWYSTLETSVGLICLGSTPTAPSARACPRYSSPSCEVYIMIGMVAVRGLFLIACTAWKPSMPGIM